MIKRFLACSIDICQSVGRYACEDGDHLPITIVSAVQTFADFLHSGWQNPIAERCAIA
ncbi:hypothetical protein D3C81_1771960 [compost metagenome]